MPGQYVLAKSQIQYTLVRGEYIYWGRYRIVVHLLRSSYIPAKVVSVIADEGVGVL